MLLGVKGRVASSWEYGEYVDNFLEKAGLASSEVNIYQASAGKLQGDTKSPGPDGSINGLCGECHGSAADTEGTGFHSFKGLTGQDSGTSMGSPWKRHPTDVVMNKQDTEYWDYPGVSGKFYSQEVPVGFVSIRNLQQTERVVLCVSCHRAHGSQYNDALRWDYDKMQTGASKDNGCFRCHTQKKGE
jgi:predicted CXXCH cytochrome family protein